MSEQNNNANAIGSLIVTLFVAAGIGYYIFGDSWLRSLGWRKSRLDGLMVIGAGTRQGFDKFEEEGGLGKDHLWHNYCVEGVEPYFDENNRLMSYSAQFSQGWCTDNDATLAGLKRALTDVCGDGWSKTNYLYNAVNRGYQCQMWKDNDVIKLIVVKQLSQVDTNVP